MVIKKDVIAKCSLISWVIAIGAYFFQFPFSKLSALILPFLFLYISLQIPQIKILKSKKYLFLLLTFFIFLIFLVNRSIFLEIDFKRILRFTVILLIIPLSFFIRDNNFSAKKEIFLNLAMVKSIILIAFGLIIIYFGDFGHFRNWAQYFGLGDIYFLNRFIPKIQVQGNALLVVAFMLDYLSIKKFTLRNIIILVGVLAAGNFAYILALIAFASWQFGKYALHLIKTNKYAKYIVAAALIIGALVLIPYISVKIEEKSSVSNAVRIEQALVLLNANPIIGDGLGCWVAAHTQSLNYNGEVYFELQTLYIFKQIGIIGLGLFYAVTLKPMYATGKTRFILYLIYLFFSFWNPYCFDITQVITILLIINTSQLGERNDKSSYYSLSSG